MRLVLVFRHFVLFEAVLVFLGESDGADAEYLLFLGMRNEHLHAQIGVIAFTELWLVQLFLYHLRDLTMFFYWLPWHDLSELVVHLFVQAGAFLHIDASFLLSVDDEGVAAFFLDEVDLLAKIEGFYALEAHQIALNSWFGLL